jgi:hypothetical protein
MAVLSIKQILAPLGLIGALTLATAAQAQAPAASAPTPTAPAAVPPPASEPSAVGTPGAAAKPVTAPFAELNGAWTGAGQIRLDGGKVERVTCKAYYTPKDGGNALGIALRCASTSYSVDLRSNLVAAGGRVTGTWEERTFAAEGNVAGRATNGNISVAINGGGLSGSMSVSFGGTSQQVSITTAGTALRGVSISLSKG